MKKLMLLFVLCATLFSCSSDDTKIVTEKKLQKVVFYRNSENERHWNFSNGMLSNITFSDGSLAEEFTYDNLGRLTKDTQFANGSVIKTDVITYNTDNTIKSINGLPYTFNASTRTYEYSYGSDFTIDCQVNSDFLVENFVRSGNGAAEYHMSYSNGNMITYEKRNNSSSEILKNFHFAIETSEPNKLYGAILSVARVKSLTDPGFFIDGVVSKVSPEGFDKGPTNPYYYSFGIIPDETGKLVSVGIEVLDTNNNPVSYYSFADYYFE